MTVQTGEMWNQIMVNNNNSAQICVENHPIDAWYFIRKNFDLSFIDLLYFLLLLPPLLFVPHLVYTHTYLPLLLRKFVISLSFICWALISLGGVVYLCNIYMFQESTFNPVHWYQRKFIFYNSSWGLQSPLDFEHSNKKKYVEKTTPSKNDDVVPFYFQIEIFNTHIKQFF